jgi:hypothetical protein
VNKLRVDWSTLIVLELDVEISQIGLPLYCNQNINMAVASRIIRGSRPCSSAHSL